MSILSLDVIDEDGLTDADVSYEERFMPHEQFGLTYDTSRNELQYNGKMVRWFEDYYTVGDGTQAGKNGESLTGGKFQGDFTLLV